MKIDSVRYSGLNSNANNLKSKKSFKAVTILGLGAMSALSIIKGKYAAIDSNKIILSNDFQKMLPGLYLAVTGACLKVKDTILSSNLSNFAGKNFLSVQNGDISKITSKNLHQG